VRQSGGAPQRRPPADMASVASVSARFEELGWQQTPMGVISLRRRFDPSVRADIFEVKLDDEHLMSSLFTVAERELARLGLARTPGTDLDVIIGGLGLGYTAQEALQCSRIQTLTVIEYSDAVLDWHQRDLLPDTVGLAADGRVTLVCADFFAAATGAVDSIRKAPAEPMTRSCSTSTTRPGTCSTIHTQTSTPTTACNPHPPISRRAARLPCGPTIRPTMTSPRSWNRCSPTSRPSRSGSTTPSPEASQPQPSTSRPDRMYSPELRFIPHPMNGIIVA